MGDIAGNTKGDNGSKSNRKAQADSGTLIHREKQETSRNCDWGPTRRPLNARRRGFTLPSHHDAEMVGCP